MKVIRKLSSKIGRICLHVVLSGPYLPLVLLLDGKFFGYLVTLFIIVSILIKVLPSKWLAYEESLLIDSLSFAVSCLLWYILLQTDTVSSCVFSILVHLFHHILTTFLINLITSVIKTIQLWVKLKNDILKTHTASKKFLYYGIWTVDKLCKVSVIIYVLYEVSNAVNYFYEDHGLKEINCADIETNDCIPYTSFPDQIWFASSDLEESVSVYYVNESLSYLGDHLIISEKLTTLMKENSKLCKTFRGEDFFVTFNITQNQHFDKESVEYYWSFNGTRILESSLLKYEFWYRMSENAYIFNFLVKTMDYKDSGMYVLHRKTTEMYSLENRKIKSQKLQRNFKQFSNNERSKIIVDRKILKFFLMHYQHYIHSYREVGTLIQINNYFKISTFRFRDSELKPIYLVNRKNIMNACPFNSSCNPTISIYHNKQHFYRQTSQLMLPVSVFKVNVSFCVCPEAYGIHEFYFLFDDYFPIRFPLSLTLGPPSKVFDSPVYLAMLECCQTGNIFKDPLDIILNSHMKQSFFYSNMEERFINQRNEEQQILLAITCICCFVLLFIDKLQRILIHYFFIYKSVEHNEQENYEPKYDVFISYCSEDRLLAEELFLPFIKKELKYSSRTQNDILGNMNTRQALKEYIQTSKVFVLVISKNYLNDSLCYKLEYEMTLLMSIVESRIEHDNVLVIKVDDCQNDVDPLKRFIYIDWTNTLLNTRSEEDKKEELRVWLSGKLKPNSIVRIIFIILKPLLSATKWLYYAGR